MDLSLEEGDRLIKSVTDGRCLGQASLKQSLTFIRVILYRIPPLPTSVLPLNDSYQRNMTL